MSWQPINAVVSALRSIGALEAGEQPTADMATDAFNLLNEMLDQWSNDHLLIYAQNDVFHELVGGQYIYTIGVGGSVGSSFYGTIAGNVLTVTQVLSGAVSGGQVVQGVGVISGTAITSLGTGVGGSAGLGTYYVNLSNNIFGASVVGTIASGVGSTTLTVTALNSGAITIGTYLVSDTGGAIPSSWYVSAFGTGSGGAGTYTITGPGSMPTVGSGTIAISPLFTSYAHRPLRINSAFVRVVNSTTGTLDYPMEIFSYGKYQSIGIKTLPGPWPRGVYYQPTDPLGVLNYWPNPSQGEVHLFCDTILNNFSNLYDTVHLPRGYQGAIHWNLAELLMPEYGKKDPIIAGMVTKQAAKGRMMIMRTNMHPQEDVQFDPALQQRARRDAGWILSGGQ